MFNDLIIFFVLTFLGIFPFLLIVWLWSEKFFNRTSARDQINQIETQNFEEAIRMLKSANLETRLTGIASLEKLAQSNDFYHWKAVEALAAMIARRRPWWYSQPLGTRMRQDMDDALMDMYGVEANPEEAKNEEEKEKQEQEEKKSNLGDDDEKPQADIQEALNAIGRRRRRRENSQINLGNTNLAGLSLANGRFADAVFTGSKMKRCVMVEGKFRNAKFMNTILEEAFLHNADLTGADMRHANLKGTYFIGTNLKEADFTGTDLSRSVMMDVDLTGAKYNDRTLMPNNMNPNYEGMIKVEQSFDDEPNDDEPGEPPLAAASHKMPSPQDEGIDTES